MKKSRAKTKLNIETEDQAKDFIAGEFSKMMGRISQKDISDDFCCEVMMYIIGSYILKKGDVLTFNHIFNQLIEKNQEVFAVDKFDSDDDGTFH